MTENTKLEDPPLEEISDPRERENHLRNLLRDLQVFGVLDEAAAVLVEKGVSRPAVVELFRKYADRLDTQS